MDTNKCFGPEGFDLAFSSIILGSHCGSITNETANEEMLPLNEVCILGKQPRSMKCFLSYSGIKYSHVNVFYNLILNH